MPKGLKKVFVRGVLFILIPVEVVILIPVVVLLGFVYWKKWWLSAVNRFCALVDKQIAWLK